MLALGCTAGADSDGGSGAKGKETPPGATQDVPRPVEGLGDIIVAGRPVTGAEPSGHPKVPYRRTYEAGSLYAAVTGYRSMAYGRTGLEAIYNDELSAGVGAGGSSGHVVTTIRPEAQESAARALGSRRGAAVAVDTDTGRILALVSTPSYDPSRFSGNATSDEEAWKKLQDDSDKPMLNRAVRDAVPPRHTFYLVVAAAALEEGLYGSVDDPTRAPLPYTLPETTTELASEAASCADASIRTALRHACDNVFAAMAVELGHDTLARTAENFGFNDEALYTPLLEATSTFPTEGDRDYQVALSGIGWGEVRATPLRMAEVMAAIANGGRRTAPTMVDRIVLSDGTVVGPRRSAVPRRQAISRRTADQLRSALETSAGVGGITGWVQPDRTYDAEPTSWCLSYAEDKKGRTIAIAVRVEDPGSAKGDVRPAVAVADRIRASVS
ncbi:penicillin-binding transpeptidase domain-containing protein [Streptomyces sp. NPDC002867]